MPPKKAPGKGKGEKKGKVKDTSKEEGAVLTPEQQLALSTANVTSLKLQLADRSLEANRISDEKRQLQRQILEMHAEMDEQKQVTMKLVEDMTRQYKGMQEELLGKVTVLEKTVQTLKDQLEKNQQRSQIALTEKDMVIGQKIKDIDALKIQIEDMAQEFGEMLKETLTKMREKIEVSSSEVEHADLPMQRKLEEVAAYSADAG